MTRHTDPADLDLFRAEVADAQPLPSTAPAPYRERPPPIPRPRPLQLPEDGGVVLSEAEVETGEFLSFSRAGVQQRVFADLRRGAFEVGLEVDLHGLAVDPARRVLADFLAECGHRRVRCARIIHGKGTRSSERQPILKHKVNYWLRLHQEVLAFCSATHRDGGTGAVYVLLRNPRKARRG